MVIKKIGKLLCMLWVTFGMYAADVSVRMRFLDSRGVEVTEAVVDSSLLLEIVIQGTRQSVQRIVIDNLDLMYSQQRGSTTQMNTVNGITVHKKIINYVVRPSKVGQYTIGPAHVTIDNQVYDSSTLTLSVIDAPRATKQDDAFVEIGLLKESAVVGEAIPFFMRVYYKSNVKVQGVEPPSFTGVKDMLLEGPFNGTKRKDGIMYSYSEWRTLVTPLESGVLKIPSAKAFYMLKSNKRFSFGDFARLFDFDEAQDVAHSNRLELAVDPLPEYKGKVDGIGEFFDFTVQSTTDNIMQGEAIVVSLSIASSLPLTDMKHPELQLPDSFTYYDSKSSERFDEADNRFIKTFEYIVQAQHEGEYTIPAQVFTFFNTRNRAYETLETDPLYITVVKSEYTFDIDQEFEDKAENDAVEDEVDKAGTLSPWFEFGPWYARTERSFSWFIILLLALAPYMFGAIWLLYGLWCAYRKKYERYYARKYAYKNAVRQLNVLKTTQQLDRIYLIFKQYAYDRYAKRPEDIETVQDREAFNIFLRQLQERTYFDASDAHGNELITQALMWLQQLEGRL